jgi:hypothetical protein
MSDRPIMLKKHRVPSGLMDSYYLTKHSDKDFIYCFNLAIGLWIVGG